MKKDDSHMIQIKISLAGSGGQGKTCLMRRQCLNEFKSDFQSTIGVDFMTKTYTIAHNEVKVQLWDLAGGQRFRTSIARLYHRKSNAVLICFALDDKYQFLSSSKILEQVHSCDLLPNCNVYLVGCKSDLEPQIQLEEILEFCGKYNMKYLQCSAKENYGVHQLFQVVIAEALNNYVPKLNQDKILIKSNHSSSTKRIFSFCCC